MEKNVVVTTPTTQSAKTTTATPTTDVVDFEIELEVLTTQSHEFQNPDFFFEIFNQSDYSSQQKSTNQTKLSLTSYKNM